MLCEYEAQGDRFISVKLLLDGVEAFKCTYKDACTPEMIRNSYDKLVDVGSSEWLRNVQDQLSSGGSHNVADLKHLTIYFDDGPSYEFICRAFRVEETVFSNESA